MPRKKAADRVGPVKTRSRSGCKECRASRVRCDTQKPICTRCRERGLVCSTQLVLKWESEFVSRGLAFGRAGVWSKSGSQHKTPPPSALPLDEDQEWCDIPLIESWGFVNSGVSTFEQPDQVNVACDELNAVVVRDRGKGRLAAKSSWPALVDISEYGPILQQLQHPMTSLPLFPHISGQNQGHLFEYYLQQVCPRTTASSKLSSPFASVILPFCLSASPILFKAIQALGACHWSRFDATYGVMGLHLKSEALRGLRHRLATEGSLSCSADPEVLAIMMMLCLYEIVDNCDERWTIHLKGAKDLIRLRRQQTILSKSQIAQDPITTFAELFFAFQDVMGRTACGEEVLFGSDYWQEDERSIDLWMGCSPELVSILSSITELSRTRRQVITDSARAAFSLRADSLGRKLENLVQVIDDDGDASDDDQTLRSAAELKRLAAVLYLHCALYGASPSTPLVVTSVRKILRLVSDLLDSGSLVSMTWPVFVAAVELDPLHDELWSNGETIVHGRPLVLRALAAMAESSVSNVARTRAVIVKVWQARDSDMLKTSSTDSLDHTMGCNDWEWHVAPISTAMSLA
ncbi:fungal-specific transcription factor domain-containing protein [Aspergillus bertholletiae]|uniref:Fungal-specific transcription factor domain-containing protein n=1 Tax=Aspergillus bertholletiae TaxID=1226010 RepID=A0A5N7AUE1_9EURO|nr:fungal-specific transcription factor domain-containing protein [Aspergillus bertholletiae]